MRLRLPRPLVAFAAVQLLIGAGLCQEKSPDPNSPEGLIQAAAKIMAGQEKGKTSADAMKLLEKAAENNHPGAQLALARLLFAGDGKERKADPERAEFLVQQAAEAGLASAQAAYGELLLAKIDPKGRDLNYSEPLAWLTKAAEQKDADALVRLGMMQLDGTAMPANPVEAYKKLQNAAKNGAPLAFNECGVCLQKGLGTERDDVAAVGYFHAGADMGSPAAMVNLAMCYRVGKGVPQDFSKAGQAVARAAALNFPTGQYLLAQMLEKGEGTKAHPVHAAINYHRANIGGVVAAGTALEAIQAKFTAQEKKEWEEFLKSGKIPGDKANAGK